MPSFQGMLRAPRIIWELYIQRKPTCNAYQNSRRRRIYVRALDEAAARAEAIRQNPEFQVVSARRAP